MSYRKILSNISIDLYALNVRNTLLMLMQKLLVSRRNSNIFFIVIFKNKKNRIVVAGQFKIIQNSFKFNITTNFNC